MSEESFLNHDKLWGCMSTKRAPHRVGVGHAGVGVSYRGWVGHAGVGWVMQGWARHARVGWGGSCRGAVGHAVHVGLITQYQKFTNGYKGMCMSGVMFLKE